MRLFLELVKGMFCILFVAALFALLWMVLAFPILLSFNWKGISLYYFVLIGGCIGLFTYYDTDWEKK